jgi:hypothetical protein
VCFLLVLYQGGIFPKRDIKKTIKPSMAKAFSHFMFACMYGHSL